MMDNAGSHALSSALMRLMRPLVRLLLRRGVSFKAFSDLVRWLYVDVAVEEFGINRRKQSVSRVSVVTGLNRKEVSRLVNLAERRDQASSDKYNLSRVILAGGGPISVTTRGGQPRHQGGAAFQKLSADTAGT
jgi:hypothetical protein